jgi:carboxypeptidase family protein/TonB-dependent receptor-like protein
MPSSPGLRPSALRLHSNRHVGSTTSCPRLQDLTGPFCLQLAFGILVFALIVSATSPVTKAQSPSATLTGTVTDQNDAVVPGVNIDVMSITQGFHRTTVTDNQGAFVVALLPAGSYTVKAEREGFTTVEHHDVVLNVNDRVALKIQLKVGTISSQTVDVIDAPALIDESAAVGTTVDRRFVENLPLNGHSFQSLITLTPGIVLVPSSVTGNSGQFSVNGQRTNSNVFTVDGISANTGNGGGAVPGQATSGTLPALTTFGGTNSLVSVDAMQEFQVQTATYSAEYGRSPGGQISIVTRAGTNEYHGSLFEYLRNDKLDANDWFANRAGQPRPPERQNDFGATFGGPIVLPRFGEGGSQPWYNGKNRTFFFFSYEGLRLRTPKFAVTNVPSVNLRQTAAPGIQPILRAFPLPNGRALANGFAEFSSGYSDANTLNATSIRIDQNFSNHVTLFGRYNYAPSRSAVRNGQSNLGTLSKTELRPQVLTVGATMIFSPTISNELRGNYSVNPAHIFFEQDGFGGTVPLAREILLLPQYAPEGTHWNGGISFNPPGLSTGFFPQVPLNNTAVNQRQLNFIDTLSATVGAHQLKFGADYRRLAPILSPRAYIASMGIFPSTASVLSGIAPLATIGAGLETRPIYHEFSAFAQDAWKLSPRLTLSLGLRWDVNPPPDEANGNDPPALTGDLTKLSSLDVAPKGSPLWKTTYNNFAPRFGVAYRLFDQPGRETVVRGGFGVFYDTGNGQGSAGFDRAPFVPTRTVANLALPLSPSLVAPPPFTFNAPYQLFISFDPNLKQPYTLQWNVAVEQSLGSNQTLEVTYVGNAGRRLLVQRTLTLSTFNPKFTSIRLVTNDSTSDYHSLQMQFQRRLSRGLQALASYTWAHALDVVSSDVVSTLLLRGNSDYDIRHNLTGAISYDVPTPTKEGVAGALLRDWSIDTRFNAQTPLPLTITSGVIVDPTDGTQIGRRVNLITGVPVYLDDPTVPGGRLINKNAFSTPPGTQQGNLGRNVIRALPAWQIDLAVRRQFNLTERVHIQFRAEAFNIFNHPNFGTINTSLTSTTFGRATNMLGTQLSGLNSLFQIGGPRSVQFGLITRF